DVPRRTTTTSSARPPTGPSRDGGLHTIYARLRGHGGRREKAMRADDMILVSVDDHLVEPPDLFEGRLPSRYADQAPRVERTEDGSDVWVFNGQTIPNIGLNAVAGRPKEEYGIEPTAFDEMRPGCWDVHERVKDMSAGGILASMCFPSFPSFSGRVFGAAGSGAGPPPAGSSPWASCRSGTRSWRPPRSGAWPPRACTPSPPPRTRRRSTCRASTPTAGTRCGRRAATRAWSSRSTSGRPASSP